MDESQEECAYVYLDFNEKLTSSIFTNKVFLRVANLHKPNPLIQINDLVFKGAIDECIGTNLFFEEVEDPPTSNNIFERVTPIRLKPIISQTKVIKLKQMKLPRKVLSSKEAAESVKLNLNQDYKTVLDKLEQGILNIEDIAHKDVDDVVEEQRKTVSLINQEEISNEPEKEVDSYVNFLGATSPAAILEAKYERLKRLARRPVKRMKPPEPIEECNSQYKDAYEYHNLEHQVLQSSDAFRTVSGPIIEETLVGGVDIDRCVLQGLIPPSDDINRVLTREERSKILTLDNFENLSIPARYLVVNECIKNIEKIMEDSSSEDLRQTDENGRTITDICNIFRKLADALKRHMAQTTNGIVVHVKSDSLERNSADKEYFKYKYDASKELLKNTEIFNVGDFTDIHGDKN